MSWSDDEIEVLKKLYAEGLTFSAIAARLPGDYTRNAVIGKVTRLGLTPRLPSKTRTAHVPGRRPERQRATKAPATAERRSVLTGIWNATFGGAPDPAPKGDNPADFPNLVALVDLEPHQCKWPIGDPKQGRFGFCGANKIDGLPYCEPHCRRAYTPPANQTRVKRKDSFDALEARRHDREEVS